MSVTVIPELHERLQKMPLHDMLARGPMLLPLEIYLAAVREIEVAVTAAGSILLCGASVDGTYGPYFMGVILAPELDHRASRLMS